jgi:hypothetical protein
MIMVIFGKRLSEYINFQKAILGLILVVGLARLGLSLAGVPNSTTKWLSISVAALIGLIYYSIRVHTTGFGSYKQLLPLHFIQGFVTQSIIIAGIVIAIFTGQDNVFSTPEYSGGGDGKTWIHVAAHLILGIGIGPLIGWLVGSVILWAVKKAAPNDRASAARV